MTHLCHFYSINKLRRILLVSETGQKVTVTNYTNYTCYMDVTRITRVTEQHKLNTDKSVYESVLTKYLHNKHNNTVFDPSNASIVLNACRTGLRDFIMHDFIMRIKVRLI